MSVYARMDQTLVKGNPGRTGSEQPQDLSPSFRSSSKEVQMERTRTPFEREKERRILAALTRRG